MEPGRTPSTRYTVALAIVITVVAINLRPALASTGPVLADIRAAIGLSGTAAAVLTAVPVLCLGVVAAAAPPLARRWGMEPVIAVALGALTAGLLWRVTGGTGVLFAGTVVASGAIAIANVLLPAVIKRDFPRRSGAMMGVYSTALSGSAALAAGVTVPLGSALRLGWRGGLGSWAAPALVALVAWVVVAHGSATRPAAPPATDATAGRPGLLRDRLAWHVTFFFGLQALSFYAVLAWLPSVYRDHGYPAAVAGLLVSTAALVPIPFTLVLPGIAGRLPNQRILTGGCTLLIAAGLTAVVLAPTTLPILWMVLLGLGQGGAFAVGLTLFVLRTRSTPDTARLSAMAQGFGYTLAAFGPLLFGAVHDLTRSWTPPLLLLLVLTVPQLVTGLVAGSDRYVGGGTRGPHERPTAGAPAAGKQQQESVAENRSGRRA